MIIVGSGVRFGYFYELFVDIFFFVCYCFVVEVVGIDFVNDWDVWVYLFVDKVVNVLFKVVLIMLWLDVSM